MAITRDRCDYCHESFADGQNVYRYTMLGSAAEFDGVEGEQIFLDAECALNVTHVIQYGKQRERMILAHTLALSVKEKGVGYLEADPHFGRENGVFQGQRIRPLRGE